MSQTELNDSGLKIAEKDLSAMSPTSNDHGRMFNHDGSSAITLADESQTTKPGFYIWDNDEETWRASGENAQNVGGYTASELATLAEDEAVTGSWNFEVPPTIAMQAIFHDGNPPEKADLNFDPVEQVELEDHISQANAHHKGYINGYQSNTLSDIDRGIDGGTLANCWETIEVNSGEFTIVDNNTIEVNEAGVYSVDYTCGIHQTSGNGRAIMLARVRINGTDNVPHTGSRCYIRNAVDGDKNSVSNHSMHSLNAGDTIEVRVNRSSGVTGHDLTEASCAVQKIS